MDAKASNSVRFGAMPADEKKSPAAPDSVDYRLLAAAARALEGELAKPLAPGLYLVSTPIGNLADMSLRALATLSRADMVFCEDTRHSRKLLSHFGLSRELQAYHEHNAAKERPRVVARVRAGQSVALIADAGTPLVSDPGNKLVRALRAEGLPVIAVPGASAILASLIASGLPTDSFFFEGFLPPKAVARRKRLETLKSIPATLVFYEAPSRLTAALMDMEAVLGARNGVVAKELTKLYETFASGPLGMLARSAESEVGAKGEFVILVAPPVKAEVTDEDIEERLGELMRRETIRDASRHVSEALGVPRNRVYRLALALKDEVT
jgi:16S rRNA (cytidine1402-2'-O)-methyltransferase